MGVRRIPRIIIPALTLNIGHRVMAYLVYGAELLHNRRTLAAQLQLSGPGESGRYRAHLTWLGGYRFLVLAHYRLFQLS
jgi:hypothetical protein